MKRYQWKRWLTGVVGTVILFGTVAYASPESNSTNPAVSSVSEELKETVSIGSVEASSVPSDGSDANVVSPPPAPASQWEETSVIPEGISVGTVNLSGMTVSEARGAVNGFVDQFLNRSVRIHMNGKEYQTVAREIGVTWANPGVVDEAFHHIVRGNFVKRYKNQVDLKTAPVALEIQLAVNEEAVSNYAQSLIDACSIPAIEPSVARVNGTFQVTEGKTGIAFNLEEMKEALMVPLADITNAEALTIQPTVTVTNPQLSPDIFSHFSEKPIGSCTTKFNTAASEANRCANIELSANNMNGHVFLPGEEISTLAMFGDVTAENGYKTAGTYLDGKVVDGIGGGICQTTTTLYDAVLAAELEVVYRRNHSMLVDYVDPAKDATVDYASGSDFKFKNNTDHPIYIEAYRKDNAITVNIYGTETRPANRKVEYVSNILEYSYPEENAPFFDIRVDPNIKEGWGYPSEKHRVAVNCHPQVQAELYKNVYVDGQLTEHTKIGGLNKYRYSSGVIYVARDTKAEIIDPLPGTNEARVLSVYLKFLDGETVGPEVPPDWSKEKIARHEAEVEKKMKELGR